MAWPYAAPPHSCPGQRSATGEYTHTHNVDPSVIGLRPSTYSGTNAESSDSPESAKLMAL